MTTDQNAIYDFFKKTIFKRLEQIDINQIEEREIVYRAAYRSLKSVHAKNKSISQDTKLEQQKILEQLIHEIEIKIVSLFSQQAIDYHVVEADVFLDESVLSGDEALDYQSGAATKSNFISAKRPLIFGVLGLLFLAALSIFYVNYSSEKDITDTLQLPHTIIPDEALMGSIRTNGPVKLEFVDGDAGGIFYEVDINSSNTSNRLDIVLRDELGKKIIALDEPILVTFHIEKITKSDMDLDFLIRGKGKISRKSVEISDQNTNEYFVISNVEKTQNPRSFVLLRLQISFETKKYIENPTLLIKKIVLSKI